MLSRITSRKRVWPAIFVTLGAIGVIGASILLPKYVTEFGFIVAPLALLAVIAVAVLLVVPATFLPSLALITFCLIPPRVLPQEGPLGALPVTTIILVVWALRRLVTGPPAPDLPSGFRNARVPEPESAPFRTAAVVSGVLFLAWSLFTLARSIDGQASLGWLISFTAGALLPLAIGNVGREAYWIRRTWLFLGGWLGAYAVVEAVLRVNPIWGTLYNVLGITDSQHWSVYRAEASFGHPLFAALFFAVACALGVGTWLTTSSRWTLTAALFSGLGLVVTVSRGALLAGGIAAVFAYAAALVARGEKRWNRFAALAGLAVVGLIGILQFDALKSRNDSLEAELSAQARDLGYWVTVQAAERSGWLGAGPGTSGIAGRQFDDVVIENSLFQLVISVGLPGVILFAALIGSAFLHALSRRAIGPAAAIFAYAMAITGFNAIDALRPAHLLLGCLLILTLGSVDSESPLPASTSSALRLRPRPRQLRARETA